MRKLMKYASLLLTGMLSIGMLSGCGDAKIDGTKTALEVDGEKISAGVVSLATRYYQAETESMYAMYSMYFGQNMSAGWDEAGSEEKKTRGEEQVDSVVESLKVMALSKEKAADYGVEITADEQKAIDAAAAGFMADNTEETIAELGVTEDDVKQFLELETYTEKVKKAVIKEAAIEIPYEDAQQSAFTYVEVPSTDDTGAVLTGEDLEARKAEAQQILDKAKEDPEADLGEIASSVNEDYSAQSGTFTTKESDDEELNADSYSDELVKALRECGEGEYLPEVVDTINGYYVAKLDQLDDAEATAEKQESVKSAKEQEAYEAVTNEWLESADIKVDKKALKNLKVTDTHKWTIQSNKENDFEVSETGNAAETGNAVKSVK